MPSEINSIERLKRLCQNVNEFKTVAKNEIYAYIGRHPDVTLYDIDVMNKEVNLYDKIFTLIEEFCH